MLKLKFGDQKSPAIWLVQPNLTIGADATNDIVIDDLDVDAFHARLFVNGKKVEIENLSEQYECYVNQELITQKYQLRPGDKILLGKAQLEVVDPAFEDESELLQAIEQAERVLANSDELTPISPEPTADKTQIRVPEVVWYLKSIDEHTQFSRITLFDGFRVGREAHCDLVIPGAHISREHAKLEIKENKLFLEDLQSANGCFVNDRRIHEKTQIFAGDTVTIDIVPFKVLCQSQLGAFEPPVANKSAKQSPSQAATAEAPEPSKNTNKTDVTFSGPWLINVADTGHKIPLTSERVIVGRWADCSAVVDDASVSSRHAELLKRGSKWSLGDLASSNGTFVNGKRIQTKDIRPGDKIRFGLTEFIFSDQEHINDYAHPPSLLSRLTDRPLLAGLLLLLIITIGVFVAKDWIMAQLNVQVAEVKTVNSSQIAGQNYDN